MRPTERRPREPPRARRRDPDPEVSEARPKRGGGGAPARSERRAGPSATGPRPVAGGTVGVVSALGAAVTVLAAVARLVGAIAPAAGTDPLRPGAVALPNWTPVAAAAVAFAACWLAAIGAAHALATAFGRR